ASILLVVCVGRSDEYTPALALVLKGHFSPSCPRVRATTITKTITKSSVTTTTTTKTRAVTTISPASTTSSTTPIMPTATTTVTPPIRTTRTRTTTAPATGGSAAAPDGSVKPPPTPGSPLS